MVCFFILICILAVTFKSEAIGPLVGFGVGVGTPKCEPTLTTASGSHVIHKINGQFCSGDLIFEDNFDGFDLRKWQHENTLSGNGHWQFQWYTNNRSNSFSEEGYLHLRPTLTSDVFGETFLSSGVLSIHGGSSADLCTDPTYHGCERSGSPPLIVNPIRSARIRTVDSFSFKYGKVEVNAKLPSGDWLLPGITFLPKDNAYGSWPSSGEIDLMQSKGNRELIQNGVNIGVEQINSKLHFGPYVTLDGWPTAQFSRNSKQGNGFNNDFHRYQLEWTPEKITFSVDDVETGAIKAGSGLWSRGGFDINAPGTENPWRYASSIAPFDQEFFIAICLAVGGTNAFPDDVTVTKPWKNSSPTAVTEFWNARNSWLPTWNLEQNMSRNATFLIDYVRIWAL